MDASTAGWFINSSTSAALLSSSATIPPSSSSTGPAVDGQDEDDLRLLSSLYLLFSLFSLVLSLTVILSYLKFPSLRRHSPSSFVFCRSLADVLYSLQFILFYSIQPPSSRASYCLYFTPLFQFSLMASQSFYFTLSLDLLMSLRNPFVSLSSSPVYHVFSFTFALVTALLIPITDSQGYRPGMEVCWIKASATSSLNAITWSLFFAPTLLFYAFALCVMAYAAWRLKAGLKETFHVRVRVLQDATRYVTAFTLYWTVTGSIYIAIWYKERHEGVDLHANFPLYAAFAVTIVLRAVFDTSAWLWSNEVYLLYSTWWRGKKEEEGQSSVADVDINKALRFEVLSYTTRGIARAALKQAAVEQKQNRPPSAVPKHYHYPKSMRSTTTPFAVRHMTVKLPSAAAPLKSSAASASTPTTPFVDVAPRVFSYLRHLWGLMTESYVASIAGDTSAMVSRRHDVHSFSCLTLYVHLCCLPALTVCCLVGVS